MLNDLPYPTKLITQVRQAIHELDLDNMNGIKIETEMAKTKCMNEALYMERVKGYNFWEHVFHAGAILAQANAEIIALIQKIGQFIGIAYIIASDTYEFGKNNLEDFQSGKITLPIIHALKQTNSDDIQTLKSLHGRKLTTELQEKICLIMVKCGAIDYGKSVAREWCQQALNLLREFKDSPVKNIIEFSTTITQRNRYYTKLETYRE